MEVYLPRHDHPGDAQGRGGPYPISHIDMRDRKVDALRGMARRYDKRSYSYIATAKLVAGRIWCRRNSYAFRSISLDANTIGSPGIGDTEVARKNVIGRIADWECSCSQASPSDSTKTQAPPSSIAETIEQRIFTMALQTVTGTNAGAGIRIDLGATDSLLVTSSGQLASLDSNAIIGTGSHLLDIHGTVTAFQCAVNLGASAADFHDNTLLIGKTGYVSSYSNMDTIRILGGEATIMNEGTILNGKSGAAIHIQSADIYAESHLENSGMIRSNGLAIIHEGQGKFTLNNSGSMISNGFVLSDGADVMMLTNTGMIRGDLFLGGGDDTFDNRSGSFSGVAYAGAGNDIVYGGASGEWIVGDYGNDKLYGYAGADTIEGWSDNDVINGGSESDVLIGGAGKDDLRGDSGADIFVFKGLQDSTVASLGRDMIRDFSQRQKDLIDLSYVDAKAATVADDVFTFIGRKAYSGQEGELRSVKTAEFTKIYGDVDGDKVSDFAIWIDNDLALKLDDFVL